ncbi:TetR/AcrR family transcriptional regulator [Yinghuangia seranimata]|uniref:TetR/AcrR family transcriptional regulator n=1 Tax=Yinghuangia seranimata TaxID=408067 RepID=UPI00248B52FC|nr:TetR/AcrR family transcriptional regulator [Yinghuangia seranimata]MDI2130027.1 TetR/AcrR family transcriptional regulator [Yinghuangia seranimata]
MNKSQQSSRVPSGRAGDSPRSQERRAELIAVGRRLFARTTYDALSIDDIAREAGVAKGLLYYYFGNKRGYYLAVVEDSVAELVARAEGDLELPPRERLLHTLDGYLRFASGHEAAYRTIVSGGVGVDAEVLAIRDRVRERLLTTIAEGAYGRAGLTALPRTALTGWLSYVEGVTLDWLEHRDMDRDSVRALCAAILLDTLRTIERFAPEYPAPTVGD